MELAGKKLFIVGAGEWQVPAFVRAREMGINVLTVDRDPHAPGFELADEFHVVDTRDQEECLRLAQETQVSGVMTMASDYALPTVSFIAESIGSPALSHETALNCLNKVQVKRILTKNGVPTAKWVRALREALLKEFAESADIAFPFDFPLVVKPGIGCGSKGVFWVKDALELESYLLSADTEGDFLLEEYLEGEEVSVEGIIHNGQIFHIAVTEKRLTSHPFFVEVGHFLPAQITERAIEEIRSVTDSAIRALALDLCAFHVEIRLTKNGPKVIEVGARMGGGAIASHMVPLATGIDMVASVIRQALGSEPGPLKPEQRAFAGVGFFEPNAFGRLAKTETDNSWNGSSEIREVRFLMKEGRGIRPLKSSSDRAGYVIASAGTRQGVERAISRVKEGVRFIVEADK